VLNPKNVDTKTSQAWESGKFLGGIQRLPNVSRPHIGMLTAFLLVEIAQLR
jgi:hypothetical protein